MLILEDWRVYKGKYYRKIASKPTNFPQFWGFDCLSYNYYYHIEISNTKLHTNNEN